MKIKNVSSVKGSLYARLALTIIITVVVIKGISGAVDYYVTKEKMMIQMREHANITLKTLQKNILPFMASYSVHEYDSLVLSEMQRHDNFAIVVEDFNMGKILGRYAYVSGKIRNKDGEIIDFDNKNPQHAKWLDESLISMKYKIVDSSRKTIGTLSVYESTQSLNTKLQEIIVSTIARSVIITVFLIIALFGMIQLMILRPISQIIESIIQTGDDGLPINSVPDVKVKEISLLANTINHLITSIKSWREQLVEQQNETNELKERLLLAWEGVNDGIWDWNIQKNQVYYSSKWKTMLGYTTAELDDSPSTFFELLHDDDKKMVEKALEEHFKDPERNIYSVQVRLKCKDGSYKWILGRGKALKDADGNPIRMVGSHTDINEQKALEERLIVAKETADHASKAKSEFLANMSHEIRTPLNGVRGLIDLTLKTDLTPQQTDYILKARQSSKALLNVLNDILDYSKIEAGKLEFEKRPFNLQTLLKDVAGLFDYSLHEKGLHLQIELHPLTPLYMIGDPLRLGQIFNNLVGNAIKFTEHGEITVKIKPIREDSSSVTLLCSVNDTGIGMDENEQAKLFQAFSQTDTSNTRKYGGTGLGLSISKQLVSMMEGEIWVDSVKGKGSSFFFSVQLDKSDEELHDEEDSALISSDFGVFRGSGNILLVEDNQINQLVASKMLEGYGLEVDIAQNGEEAVKMAREGRYDVIFMDLQMPLMDGFESTRRIREFNLDIPIIALSAAVMNRDKGLTKEAGMDDHLSKPIEPEELEAILRKYLSDFTYEEVETQSSAPVEEVYGIDMTALAKKAKEPQTREKFLSMFAESYRNIDEVLQSGEIENEVLKGALHSLKGVSGNIGAMGIHSRVKEIENTKEPEKIKALLDSLRTELAKVISAIDGMSAHDEHQEKIGKMREEEISALIASVKTKLMNNEYVSDEILHTLFGQLRDSVSSEALKSLQGMINRFEYEAAVEQFNEILKNCEG